MTSFVDAFLMFSPLNQQLALTPHYRDAASEWAQAFALGLIKKVYLAVVSPAPADSDGVIVSEVYKGVPSVGQGNSSRERMITRPSSGRRLKGDEHDDDRSSLGAKSAVTEWKLLHRGSSGALLLLQPVTGRTHQLRVHCADVLRCPVVGDRKYGPNASEPTHEAGTAGVRLQLHAAALVVPQSLVTPQLLKLCKPLAAENAGAPAANAVVKLGDGRCSDFFECVITQFRMLKCVIRVLICASMPSHMQQALQVIARLALLVMAACSPHTLSPPIAGNAGSRKLVQHRCTVSSSAIMSSSSANALRT